VVSNTGAKKWVLRFTIDGKRREMGLGSFPDVGLAEARDKVTKCRKLAKDGVDPIEARQAEPEKTPTLNTVIRLTPPAGAATWTSCCQSPRR